MSEWVVRHSDGSTLKDEQGNDIIVKSLEYSGSWMGDSFVTITFKNPAPILFKIGDYIIYRNEVFEINYDPGKIKQSRRNEYGEAFVYDNVKFNAKQDELARTEFLDIVLHDNNIHYTALTKFAFYISSLDDLLDRIQANLDEQWGNGKWKLYSRNRLRSGQRGCDLSVWDKIYGNGVADNVIDSTSITADNLNCWSTLALINSQFDVNFITRGRNVFVGTAGLPTTHIFGYGKNNGLYQIEQNADSEQAITTRLRAYGSTKNIPNRYYATLNLQVYGTITKIVTKQAGQYNYTEFELDLPFKDYYFFNELTTYSSANNRIYYAKIKVSNKVVNARIYNENGKTQIYSEYVANSADPDDNTDQTAMQQFINSVIVGARVYFLSGVKKESFPATNKDYATDNLPNNMAIDRLMLPGFPNKSLKQWWDEQSAETKKRIYQGNKHHLFSENKYRPYVDSTNVSTIGVRPSSVYFDTKDIQKGIEEIYPTIEKMEIGGVRIDEVLSAKQIDDNGVFKDGATIPNFSIFLKKEIDFDINDLLKNSTEQPYICMKNGMCGGRQFKIASARKLKDGSWELTCERVLDDSLNLYFPYNDYQIKPNDHFVLIGIPLPDSYVEAASIRLLKYALAFLDKNDYTRYIYSPKIDEVYMQRQHDSAIADTTGSTISLHDTIKEGDILQFEDSDLHIDGKVTIDQLTIRENEDKIPTYEITLREDKSVGTIQKIQEKINSLESGNGGEFSNNDGGITIPQLQRLIESFGGKRFISKLSPDTAQELITFLKGLKLGNDYSINELGEAVLKAITSANYNALEQAGFGITQTKDGKYQLNISDLNVWRKAVFNEIEKRKLSYVGGNFVFSSCGSKIKKVEDKGSVWRCYFYQDDGSTATTNLWDVDDQARCQIFNIKTGVYAGVANRNYWRRVMAKGDDYIDLSKTDCEQGSDVPQVDDTLVQFGNRTKTDRQNIIEILTTGDEAPAIVWYSGVNSYSLEGKSTSVISPKKVEFNTNLFRLITRSGARVPLITDRGAWLVAEKYSYYDRVSDNGRLWLCIAQGKDVTSRPSDNNPDWQLQVDKGANGTSGKTYIRYSDDNGATFTKAKFTANDNLLDANNTLVQGTKVRDNYFSQKSNGNTESFITFFFDNTSKAFAPNKTYCVQANVSLSQNNKDIEVFIYDKNIKSINKVQYLRTNIGGNAVIRAYITLADNPQANWSHVYIRFDNNGSTDANDSQLDVFNIRVTCIDDLKGINQLDLDATIGLNNINRKTASNFFTEDNLPCGAARAIHVESGKDNEGIFFPNAQFVYPNSGMNMVFSVYMRSTTTGLQIYQHIEGNTYKAQSLTPDWKRYEVVANGTGRGHTLCLYTNKAGEYDVCCPQFGFPANMMSGAWMPSIQEENIGTTTGKYIGIASWDKPYPPLNPNAYTWSAFKGEDGKDAEIYRLKASKESAKVTADGLLICDAAYTIEHVQGTSVEVITSEGAAGNKPYVSAHTDKGVSVSVTAGANNTILYKLNGYFDLAARPDNIIVELYVKANGSAKIVDTRVIPILMEAMSYTRMVRDMRENISANGRDISTIRQTANSVSVKVNNTEARLENGDFVVKSDTTKFVGTDGQKKVLIKDGKVSAELIDAKQIVAEGIQGNTIDAKNATFNNVNVSGTLKGVSGTFRQLQCENYIPGEDPTTLMFDSEGKFLIRDGDLIMSSQSQRKPRLIPVNTWVMGTFGAKRRTTMVVKGTTADFYLNDVKASPYTQTLETKNTMDGVVYEVPCFCYDNSGHTIYEFPVDTIVFNIDSASTFRYELVMYDTQRCIVINANDKADNVYIYSNGVPVRWDGGEVAEVIKLPITMLTPKVPAEFTGAGLMVGAFRDNNWGNLKNIGGV